MFSFLADRKLRAVTEASAVKTDSARKAVVNSDVPILILRQIISFLRMEGESDPLFI